MKNSELGNYLHRHMDNFVFALKLDRHSLIYDSFLSDDSRARGKMVRIKKRNFFIFKYV